MNEGTTFLDGIKLAGGASRCIVNRKGADLTLLNCEVSGCTGAAVKNAKGATAHLVDTTVSGNGCGVESAGRVAVSGRVVVERNEQGDLNIGGTPLLVEDTLADGARMGVDWKYGIHVRPGCSLTIYGQDQGTGELHAYRADADAEDAGIGGNAKESGSTITICGAHVTAKGGPDAAGIGGGGDGSFFDTENGGDGGDAIIEGNSVVEAKSSDGGSAIGHSDDTRKPCGTVTLDDCLQVINLDKGKDAVVAADKREHTCLRADYVKVEPCKHKDTYYEWTDETHTLLCKHCKGLVDRTDAHHWDAGGCCTVCGCKNASHVVTLSEPCCATDGDIALLFGVDGPFGREDDHRLDDARIEVAIGGKSARTVTIEAKDAEVDVRGRRLFRFPLSVVEMAEPVTATFVYCGGSDKIVQTTSLEKCIARDAEDAARRREARCLRSIANMGYYMQRHLSAANGWALGKDYAKVGLRYDKDLAGVDFREAFAQHAPKVSTGDSAVANVNMSATFGSKSTMDVRLTTKVGAAIDAKATFGGEEVPLVRGADGCYRAHVEGIQAQDLDKCLRIEGDCNGAFSMDVSVLSYASSAYGAKGASDATKQAMAAVLQYHEAAVDWAASR